MQNARKYNYFSNFYKVNFTTLKNIKKEYYYTALTASRPNAHHLF